MPGKGGLHGRTIIAKYPGVCRDCGTDISKGDTIRWYGRGQVYGTTCHEQVTQVLHAGRPPVGRCEDAPCCGCCPDSSGEYASSYVLAPFVTAQYRGRN